ncbi:disulfide bond formation protein B [Halomonas denitrificans]|uniref:disulfide bond formation protein B n=1 Tax=Halomonas TaxID=2745 RepID=UPI001A8ED89F|nr:MULTISPECIES: disulfide bond formation protein B [Halomonas]MED5294782.1 disulfide bond formation protein B [Pseudomonadota bacterium]MBN8412181.1 disulfide bond formation protein B [Halomonas litopenaei]MBY5924457.1 disulfide bond formation protein B [Halomonas sp. DP4Y7-2]MBY6231499.1 disulfide bond formation protein B [Halomonas sp. DP4Y7-1]MCA0975289.1 disulfide bond formation protein B [Halomonas denitrificans]
MSEWSLRQWSLVGLGFCVMMMAVALVLEHVVGLEPCPLCVFQRVAVIAAGVVFAIAALHGPEGRLAGAVYSIVAAIAVLSGAGLAMRHLWLQSLPADQVPSCGPGLDYMVDILPLSQVVSMVLTGSGECAEVGGRLLGLSLPGWTLIGFVVLLVVPIAMLTTLRRSSTGYRWNG